ncbi:SBBP repeat-containing protein, partial [Candidatus Pacearchaeota archaeon]|nr:SBBP repeat-containing protein [Candidatus Pacearchaeota archaeon]
DLAGTGNAGSADVFITKYDASGNRLWIKQFGSTDWDDSSGIAVDANGNSYVTGNTSGDLAGTGHAGLYDVFMTKYDTSGNPLWIKQFGSANHDYGSGIAVDANGNSYVTGSTYDDLAGTGNADVFIAHLYP